MSSTSAAISPPVRPRLSERLGVRLRGSRALTAAVAVFVVASAGLLFTHRPPRIAVPKVAAVRHALADPLARQMLRGLPWNHVELIPLDARTETLAFERGDRLLATVNVGWSGHIVVLNSQDLTGQKFTYGSGLAHDRGLLALLTAGFVLMTAVWPLRRLRNLDVLVTVASVASIVLLDEWRLDAMVLASYAVLIYLAIRCAWRALGSARDPGAAIPLWEVVTRRWSPARQVRILRLAALALALIVAMVGFSSLHVLDVGYAVMEGATSIVHGLLPYGHIADVFHGDTYPFGSYLLYVPLASLWPVHSEWNNADPTLVVAIAAALICAWGLWRMSAQGAKARPARPERQEIAGLRNAIAWMAFPPLLVTVSTGTTDVALAALLVGALILWRRPAASTSLVSIAAWFKLVPLALLPMWLARFRGRTLLRGVAAITLVSVPMLGILFALGGLDAPARMFRAMSFQLTRQSPTLWTLIGSVPLQQLAQAATLALIAGTTLRLRTDHGLAGDRARFAAACAAVLLGLQISGNYWSYMYLVWVLPFLALSVLAPEDRGRERS